MTITIYVSFVYRALSKNTLKSRYAGIWIPSVALAILSALFPSLVTEAARITGFQVASNFALYVSLIFLAIITLILSTHLSRLESRSEKATIEIALLRHRVEELEKRGER